MCSLVETMKTAAIEHSFEINIRKLLNPTSVIAVGQSINTLTTGGILKVSACNKNTVIALVSFCKNSGNTLLEKIYVNDEITLFIKKK